MTIDNFANPYQREGYQAYNIGIPLTQNPYSSKDKETEFYAEQWINGWAWARTDHKQENRTAQEQQQ
jgi:hypothetical protein